MARYWVVVVERDDQTWFATNSYGHYGDGEARFETEYEAQGLADEVIAHYQYAVKAAHKLMMLPPIETVVTVAYVDEVE